ncbi:MAG: acylneuraminate cytidylyltransferase family protein [Planctomycetes bacterium]|nr:acylneuraminate cytidylyltransferase family protein [Planctomycetota bacterium]
MTTPASHLLADTLCIILARRGSKGVPGKNTAPLAGRPCIAWTIDFAQRSTSITNPANILLSTDDPHAARLGTDMGCTLIARPANLASDTATIDDAARHAVSTYEVQLKRQWSGPIVILYANVPIRPADLLDRAVHTLITTRCHSVQSFAHVGKHHPWWTVRIDDQSRLAPWEGDTLFHNTYRRQLLPPAYIPDGGIIALTRAALFQQIPSTPPGPHAFLGTDRRAITTSQGDVIDIDTPLDLAVADALLRQRALEHSASSAKDAA